MYDHEGANGLKCLGMVWPGDLARTPSVDRPATHSLSGIIAQVQWL
jgi:hypothetical protein